MHIEELMWNTVDPKDLWVLDKLILSRYLGYRCGPSGTDVSVPGWYCVRPCVNAFGMGLDTQKVYIEKSTDHLPPGTFWCEWFEGEHLSVDYEWGKQRLCVSGIKRTDTFVQWDKWVRVSNRVPLPDLLKKNFYHQRWINCEFIGGKLIEVHFRYNNDFRWDNDEYIPVWTKDVTVPDGYTYVDDPESVAGRVGALIR